MQQLRQRMIESCRGGLGLSPRGGKEDQGRLGIASGGESGLG